MTRWRTSAVVVVLALSVAAAAVFMSDGVPGRPVRVNSSRLLTLVMQRLELAYLDSTVSDGMYGMAMRGMLRQIGDPFASYLDPERLALLRDSERADAVGVGMELDERDGSIVVVSPYAGSTAERAGLRSGDRVVAVAGRSVVGMSAAEVRLALHGVAGSDVEIGVERRGAPALLRFVVDRDSSLLEPVRPAFMLTSDVAYLRVNRINAATSHDIVGAMDRLVPSAPATILLDLRGNPGGSLEHGAAVADLFLPAGAVIATSRGRRSSDSRTYTDRTPARWEGMELILLVDEGTAGGSEVVAGALQDLDRALIVGRPTYGKGSEQGIIPLSGGAGLMLTTARWYTALGRSIDAASDDRGQLTPSARATRAQPPPVEFRSASGRELPSGSGIRPDVAVRAAREREGVLPMAVQRYAPSNAGVILQRDPDVRTAVTLATAASGQADLLNRAADWSETDAELRW